MDPTALQTSNDVAAVTRRGFFFSLFLFFFSSQNCVKKFYKYTLNHWKHFFHFFFFKRKRKKLASFLHTFTLAQSPFYILNTWSKQIYLFSGQTLLYILFFFLIPACGKYRSWQTEWLSLITYWTPAVKRLPSGMNQQTEQFFIQMNMLLSPLMLFFFFFSLFLPQVRVTFSSSIIHYVHNVYYWLLFPQQV